jgi:hypothetical protein
MLYFLRGREGQSLARDEWSLVSENYPREADRLLQHVVRVEALQTKQNNVALSQAMHVEPDLYYWEVNGVFVIYTYDGKDLVIVSVGHVTGTSDWHRVIEEAKRRI